ncbi:MAG: ABC transporter ATP-binding protein, partial [Pirellulales bacterium]|nr:ABC transporter ATP-binding protein [Pirellulales bacterium]
SHDRHFMKRVATCIVEVRDQRVVNYRGDYEAYLYMVNREIEEGEREAASPTRRPAAGGRVPNIAARAARRSERDVRKELGALERNIARLDEQKKKLNGELMTTLDAANALRCHNELTATCDQLAAAEERWLQLQEELADE